MGPSSLQHDAGDLFGALFSAASAENGGERERGASSGRTGGSVLGCAGRRAAAREV